MTLPTFVLQFLGFVNQQKRQVEKTPLSEFFGRLPFFDLTFLFSEVDILTCQLINIMSKGFVMKKSENPLRELGRRERQIVEAVVKLGEASVSQVLDEIF